MIASELIAELQGHIDEVGDLEVIYRTGMTVKSVWAEQEDAKVIELLPY